ncbi:MAG: ABC transporter ATP-binding protein [Kofleriaceae bacterium]
MTAGQLSWAWPITRPYRRALAALAGLSLAEIGLRILAPFAMVIVIDHALGTAPLGGWVADALSAIGGSALDRRGVLFTFAFAGLVLQVGHQLVVLCHGRLSVRVGQGMISDVREQLFARVQAWSLNHHGAAPTGDVVQRLETDTRCIEHILLRAIYPMVFSLLTLIVMFGVLAAIDVWLALLALAIVPPLFGWLRYYARKMAPSADHARSSDSRLSSVLYETMSAIRLVKSHAREPHEQQRFSTLARDNAHAWIGVGHRGAVFTIVTGVLTVVGSSSVLVVGGMEVLGGRISLGTLLLVIAYLGYIYGPLSAIANTSNNLHQAFASARRIQAAFAIAPENHDVPHAIAADAIRGRVSFENVSFSYGPGAPVLDRVTFTADPGEMIALVGPSGAGKSTLASLLVRFYDPASGRIAIDGVPLDRFALRSLRQRIAIVLQDALITSGTIADNIRYGRASATDADVERAACAANADEFIRTLPASYATQVGERGARLSGGQRQRLSIARAFVMDAPILILDEPTAALDTIAEIRVVEAVRRLCAGRTTFVVAHRLSTVREADRILVMDRGRIVAQGSHRQLLDTSALYRQLASQLEGGRPEQARHVEDAEHAEHAGSH